MKDRYLYRAKRTDNGEWIIGVLIIFETIAYIMEDENTYIRAYYDGGDCVDFDMRAYKVDTSTICQCTGLKDKNGKLIWENDIVKSFNGIGDECSISKIVFTEDYSLSLGWCTEGIKSLLKHDKRVFSVGFKERDAKKSEVIGNIFDNPELLEVE